MGIAAQTLGSFIAACFILYDIFSKKPATPHLHHAALPPLLLGVAFLAWGLISDFLNPQVEMQWRAPFGYMAFAVMPWLLYKWKPIWRASDMARLRVFVAIVIGLWGLVALSQFLVGWRVLGMEFVSDAPRPRGFYSHPLTLAYAALFFMPLAIKWLLSFPRHKAAWSLAFGVSCLILTTYSRTILALSALLLIWNVITSVKGKVRAGILVLAFAAMAGLFSTDNPVTNRFKTMFSEKGENRFSDYPDDRLAFWHAHWEMIKERPIVGHGGPMDTAYRLPYYKKIGLAGFSKPYEAHNAFIQVLAQFGLMGLSLFLSWLFWLKWHILRYPKGFARPVLLQTFWVFVLACLTQNGFQDSEVRMGLWLFAGGALCFLACQKDSSEKNG